VANRQVEFDVVSQRGTTGEYDDFRQESVADCVRAIGKR
jgi:hypothetical protein